MRRAWLLFVLSGCELIVGSNDPQPLVLDRLTITPGKLDQLVDGETIHYTATVPVTETVMISAHSPDPDISVQIQNGTPFGNGGVSQPIPVTSGDTLTVKLKTNELNVEASYTIKVNIAGAQFAAPVTHPLGFNDVVSSIEIADVSGDGTPDVIVGFANKGFSVYNGKTFTAIGTRATMNGFAALAVADLDGTKGPDIVAVASGSSASVFLNPGNGSFSVPTSQVGTGTHFTTVAIGKIDDDNNLDVMLGDEENQSEFAGSQQWMLGNGDGTFGSPKPNKAAGAQPAGMIIGDLDATAGHDVMVLAGRHPGLTLLRSDAAGNLVQHGATSTFNGEPEPSTARALVTGAFDGKPAPDYAVLHTDKDEVRLITNFQGDDTNPPDSIQTSFPACQGTSTQAVADLDGDGHQDLLIPCSTGDQLLVLYGDGAGGFTPFHLTVGGAPTAIGVADFNSDGKLDIVTANAMNNELAVLIQGAP